jgi:nicotinate-nucleotide adenylyltransferase
MNHIRLFTVILSVLLSPKLIVAQSLDIIPNDSNVRVGIYIGTFDPPHLGHLRVAKLAIASGYVDYVLFLPNDNAHHKPQATPFHLRYQMSQLTVSGQEHIITPNLPAVRNQGYVKDILLELQQKKSNVQLVGMLGTDIARKAVEIFHDQKFWMGIVESFLINEREGYDRRLIPHEIEGRKVHTFIAQDGGVSSTQIRDLVAKQSNEIFALLDPKVVDVIHRYHLYTELKSCYLIYLRPAL